jgi:hypothetical protein
MKQSKKCTSLCNLESLKSTIFNQEFNKIRGGSVPPPIPGNGGQTGDLIDIIVDGKVVGQYNLPETPGNIGLGF